MMDWLDMEGLEIRIPDVFFHHFNRNSLLCMYSEKKKCLKISARKCQQKPCLRLLPGSQMFESLEMALPQEACWCVEIFCMNWLQCFTGAGEAKDEHLETVSKTAAASLAEKKQEPADEICSSNGER